MAAAEPHRDRRYRRQPLYPAIKAVLLIQQEKDAVVLFKRAGAEIFGGNADPHFAQKHRRFRLAFLQPADGPFHIQRTFDLQGALQPGQPAGRQLTQRDLIQPGGAGILQLAQAVFDFALDDGKLLLLLGDRLLLPAQHLLDHINLLVVKKGGNLRQGHIQCPQVADGIERFKLAGAVIAVAGVGIDVFRGDKAHGFVVAQTADTQVEHPGHITDGKKIVTFHANLPSAPPGDGV